MRSMVPAAFAVLLMLGSTVAYAASLGCGEGSRRVLQSVGNAEDALESGDGAFVICSAGRVLWLAVERSTGQALPNRGLVFVGTASSSSMGRLGAALRAARVAFLQDCEAPPLAGDFAISRYTWSGRGGRSNTFVVSSEGSGQPTCSVEVEEVRLAVTAVLSSAFQSEDGERIAIF